MDVSLRATQREIAVPLADSSAPDALTVTALDTFETHPPEPVGLALAVDPARFALALPSGLLFATMAYLLA